MKLSARNQFQGTVTKITEGQAMAEVTVKVGTLEFVAAITEGSVKSMGLMVNDSVLVAVKATEVMIWKVNARYLPIMTSVAFTATSTESLTFKPMLLTDPSVIAATNSSVPTFTVTSAMACPSVILVTVPWN